MSGITTHVLDTSRGMPAAGILVELEFNHHSNPPVDADWQTISSKETNADGRVPELTSDTIQAGHYRINFFVDPYFHQLKQESFYPVARIEFRVTDTSQHYHVPLLLNPFGYSTYRGS